jgi:hypothetical protein
MQGAKAIHPHSKQAHVVDRGGKRRDIGLADDEMRWLWTEVGKGGVLD